MLALVVAACSYTAPADVVPMPDTPVVDPDAPPPDTQVVDPDGPEPDGPPALPMTTDHEPTADTWIQVNFATTNFANNQFVITDGDPLCVSLLRFDLSGLAGSTVSSAELHLFTNFDSGAPINVFVMNEGWSETESTWNQRANGQGWMAAGAAPPSRGTTAIAAFNPNQADSEFTSTFSVATVQAWIDAPASNFGIAIASVNADGPKFYSREAASFRPMLRITHTP